MSHFTVTVALPGTLSEEQVPDALTAALAPFDENLKVARYVEYTREQLIAKGRKEIEEYRAGRFYQEFIEDPYAYAAKTDNLRHLEYLAGGTAALEGDPIMAAHAQRIRDAHAEMRTKLGDDPLNETEPYERMPYAESFPAKLDWDDEQVYASELRWHEEENLTPEGGVYSERNPQSQWDWYQIGGRWAGYWLVHEKAENTEEMTQSAWANRAFKLGEADQKYVDERTSRPGRWVDVARKYDIDFAGSDSEDRGTVATFAFLDSDGNWHEKGRMGWFGTSSGDKAQEEWNAEYEKLVAAQSDNAWFVLVDAHI